MSRTAPSPLGSLVRIRTGKLDANANDPSGQYPFFTCSKTPLRISSYSFDCECVLVAGNGDLNVKYYQGKFDAYQRTYIIESSDSKVLSPKYLFRFLSEYIDELRRGSVGGVIKFIKLGHLTEALIPVPQLAEQERIVKLLDEADELRKLRAQADRCTTDLIPALFHEMFGDPATNPYQWPKAVLGDVIFAAQDGPHVSPKYSPSGVPFISARHVKQGHVIWEDLKFLSEEEVFLHWKKCKPEKGDVLYTKGGTTGIAAAITFDTPVAVWVHIALLKTNHEKVDPIWLENMLNSSFCYQQSQELTHGIANRDLGLTRMIKINMYLPPLPLQQEFAQRVSEIRALQAAQAASRQRTEHLFQSMLHRAFDQAL